MNAKKAKAIRRAMLPGRDETGMSRGAFLRTLTQYEVNNVKRFALEYPMDEDGTTPEPFRWATGTKTLDPNCPRGLYRTIKRRYANG